MKNKAIALRREEALIYKHHYRPSLNLLRFFQSIFGTLIFGHSTAIHKTHFRKK